MEYFGIHYFFLNENRIYWLYILSAFILAFTFVLKNPRYSFAFSKKIWWHESAKNDYLYFIVISFIKLSILLPLITYFFSGKDVSLFVTLYLEENFGFIQKEKYLREFVVVLYTLTLFIVGDLSRYVLHRLLHTVPFLWRLHQVHHSAEVLNPLTFYRVHPFENILFALRYSLVFGLVTGTFIYIFGASIGIVEIAGANVFVFVFGILGANLRHSHIPLRYGRFLEKIFTSPYMHQLHHSTKYQNKNYGGILSIWDYMFNSLEVGKTDEVLEFGLKNKKVHSNVFNMLIEPLRK
ncbi:MAG: sterol desaturase/sphingolipid hydroxylase (fatty acid hydroxylase superfamily) [Sulfurimonas sp.]|uniref:sterol desaturase family protein n=1 Tax=Sulfurimonas sp. TaxID=2022749 RepID=UPI0039E484DC